jgi:predicted DNA-binding ribbon-helix-helix protein
VIAPAAQGTARMGEDLAIVLDGDGDSNGPLAAAALEQLAGRDRLAVIDAGGASVVVPSIPASHRSLALAAVEKRIHEKRGVRNLAGALRVAASAFADTKETTPVTHRVLVLSDGKGDALSTAVQSQLEAMASKGIIVSAIASNDQADINSVSAIGLTGAGMVSTDPGLDDRIHAVKIAIPAAGKLSFSEVTLTFEGTPAPSHVLEASGGDVVWRLDAGELALGDVHAGEARTEIVRVTVPAWVPHEKFNFTVTAHYVEAEGGVARSFSVQLPCVYDDDIERIANSRHGDVIAYASALATLRKLDAAFVGDGVNRAGGLRALAQLHARSMSLLARDTRDPAIIEQAEVLNALLSVSH